MKSVYDIAADFDKLIPVKDELLEMNEDIKHISNESLAFHIDEIKGIWQEDASLTFLIKEENLRLQISNEQMVVREILEDITTVSEMLYKIEQINEVIGRTRRYV